MNKESLMNLIELLYTFRSWVFELKDLLITFRLNVQNVYTLSTELDLHSIETSLLNM